MLHHVWDLSFLTGNWCEDWGEGLSLYPLHWKCGVVTTALPGKLQGRVFQARDSSLFICSGDEHDARVVMMEWGPPVWREDELQSRSGQLLLCFRPFAIPWTAAQQASLSITSPQGLFRLRSIESAMPAHHLILCRPFSSYLQSFPASGSLPLSQFFTSGGQSIGASASVHLVNIQDWSPSRWTGWISLQSKGLSRVFSSITVEKHQFFGAQLSLWSNSHIRTWPLEKS